MGNHKRSTMMRKMVSCVGVLGILTSAAYAAASASVWNNVDGNGTVAPAVWYSYPEKGATNANGATGTLTTGTDKSKVFAATVSTTNTSSSAGLGFNWSKTATGSISLANYAGLCVTYSATQPVQVEFKQPSVKDYNYHGIQIPAKTKKDTLFIAFSDLAQDPTWGDAVDFDISKQQSVQFAYKQSIAKETGVAKNTITLYGLSLGSSCSQHAPVLSAGYANGDVNTLNEGDVLSLDLTKVFTDEDEDIVSYTVAITGDVVLADSLYKTGSLNLKTKENPSGSATVKVTATDGTKKSVTYQFTVETVDSENAPVAVDDTYETKEETRLSVGATSANNIFKNDYDADGDKFEAELVDSTAHGTLTFTASSGAFTYHPEKDFFGTDVFTYRLIEKARSNDPTYEVRTSDIATVTITVKNVDDSASVTVKKSSFVADGVEYTFRDTVKVEEDFGMFTVEIPTENVVFSDPDAPTGDVPLAVKASGIVSPAYALAGDNYVIDISSIENANGVAKVTLYVEGEESVNVFFYVKVLPVSDSPIAYDDSYTVVQDSVNKILKAKGVLVNDKDPDNAKSSLKAYLFDDAIEGKVTLAEDGSFTYEVGHYEGEDTFVYYVVNAAGDTSETAVVTLNVVYKNQPPQPIAGVADTASKRLSALKEDFSGAVTFLKKEMQTWFVDDLDTSSKLTFTARSDDSLLAPTVIASTGAIQVKSVRNACGNAELIIVAKDTKGATGEIVLPAVIACSNDRPVITKSIDTLYAGLDGVWNLKYDLNSNVVDPDGDALTFKVAPIKESDKFAWSVENDILSIVSNKDSVIAPNTMYPIAITVSDAEFSGTFKLLVVAKEEPASIAPVIATPKKNWQNAILASQGSVAIFDMQGRVMWQAKLPVSEAAVRNAAAQVQGRKILQVNKQTWTIK